MQEALQIIATTLSITQFDVYILIVFFFFLLFLALMGIQKIYETFFGIVLGIGIFIVLQVLFSPQFQTPETQKFLNETISKLVVGSSVYLIFILSILMPLNGWLPVSYSKDPTFRIFQTLGLSAVIFVFYLTVIFGFMERAYIFNIDNAFSLIKNTSFFSEWLQGSVFYSFAVNHIQIIIIFGMLFMIYKLLFGDMVNAIVIGVIASALKKWKTHGHQEEDQMDNFLLEDDHGGDHGHGHH